MNKANKQQVPKYRFQKFLDNWEKMPLSFFSRKATVKNRDESIKETFTNSAEFGIVSQRDFFDKDISNTTNIGGYYIVEENDFVYNPRISNYAPFGPINRNKLGRKGIMSPLYHVFRTKDVNHDFLSSYFETTRWHKFMYITGDKGARADRFAIGYTEFEKMPIYMPKLEEQIQIGNFFQQLDKLIELQTRAVESAGTYKKAMLQKMFPQKGEKVPRVRFEGFSGDWLFQKFSEIFDYERPDKYIVKNTEYLAEGIPVLTANKSFLLGYTDENNIYKKGDCIIFDDFTLDSKFVNFPFMVKSSAIKILTPKEGIHLGFAFERLNTARIINEGHARHYISIVQPFKTPIPSLEEQIAIGNFFQKLDQQIEQQAQKLATYQQLKKAMLQRMFV